MFARSIDDLALAAEAIVGHDDDDPDTQSRAQPPFCRVAAAEPPRPPVIAVVRTPPMWGDADNEMREAFEDLVGVLADRARPFELPESARDALQWHRTIMDAEMAFNFEHDYDRGRDRMSAVLRELIERGRAVSALDYQCALARIKPLNEGFTALFQSCDAILTPAASGAAPRGLNSTGSPAFCTLWTLAGMPAVNLPLMHGASGLPIGAQLVGARGNDAQLLRTARWLETHIGANAVNVCAAVR